VSATAASSRRVAGQQRPRPLHLHLGDPQGRLRRLGELQRGGVVGVRLVVPSHDRGEPGEHPVGGSQARRHRHHQVPPAEREHLLIEDRCLRHVVGGDAGVGEEAQRRRPERVARDHREPVRREPVELGARVVEPSDLGEQHGEAGTPDATGVGRRHLQEPGDLVQPPLEATDREQLQAVDPFGAGHRAAAHLQGTLGRRLGVAQPGLGQGEDARVAVQLHLHERHRQPDEAMAVERVAGFLHAAEGDERAHRVRGARALAPQVTGGVGVRLELLPLAEERLGVGLDERARPERRCPRLHVVAGEPRRPLERRGRRREVAGARVREPEGRFEPGPERSLVAVEQADRLGHHDDRRTARQTRDLL
jgi:hypothetical protein